MMFKNEKVDGQLKVSKDVIFTIAKNAVLDIDGVCSIANAKKKMLKGLFVSHTDFDSINIDFANDTAEISVFILVNPGVKVKSVAEQVQNRVKNEVQSMTGITVSKVNVTISDIKYN